MCNKIKPFIQCRNCPRREKDGPAVGYYYDKVDGYQVIKECSCHKKWREEVTLTQNMIQSGVVPDYTFDNYCGHKSLRDLNALRKIAEYPDRFVYKTMIYVYGPNSCQKTSMCQALAKDLIMKGYKVQFTYMSDLVSALVKEFDDPHQEKKDYLIQRCADCDFLFLDESFDKTKVTIFQSGYQIPFLDNFLRSQFEIEKKTIIFISNILPNQIEEAGYSPSLQALIERNVKNSTLKFQDKWIDNVNKYDRLGLFNK